MASVYHRVLNHFPKGHSFAFAYGSGVFKQVGHKSVKDNMMDFIFAVHDPFTWHQENQQMNPKHYSLVKYGGPKFITNLQNNWGAKISFNTLVHTPEGLIKYGVISRCNLITDLLDWETLYVSGRLHKPVLILHQDKDEELQHALKINLFSAVHTALLILPESFTEEELYVSLAAISYAGDFRMMVGEDQNKVCNIVGAQMHEFRHLYMPILQELSDYVLIDSANNRGEQDTSPPAKLFHFSMLPKKLQLMLVKEWNKDGRSRDLEDVLRAAAQDPECADMVHRGIRDIVQISSVTQSLKGIITAGFYKSVKYSLSKLKKMVKSMRKQSI